MMKTGLILFLHCLTLIVRLAKPGGAKAIVTENLSLKHQLLIAQRRHHRAPNLTVLDRYLLGWSVMLLSPRRILRSAIVVKPATIVAFHRALVSRKYRLLFGSTQKAKPGPKGPSKELIRAIVEIKQRNPRFGCPRIAMMVSNIFSIEIDKDVVRRVLATHYIIDPNNNNGPSWLSFIAHMKDSLWSIDLFRCESISLQTHWVLVVMNQWSRRIIGFAVHPGSVDGIALCRMFNRTVSGLDPPSYLSTDNDPLFTFHRWRANLRILSIDEIKTIPYTPVSHPFVERLIGTIRREHLDQTFFWNATDLQRKLNDFKTYYNIYRAYSSLSGQSPCNLALRLVNPMLVLITSLGNTTVVGFFKPPLQLNLVIRHTQGFRLCVGGGSNLFLTTTHQNFDQ